MINFSWVVICLILVGIWMIIEVKRLKHKVFAIIFITLIIFAYTSFSSTVKDSDLNLKKTEDLFKAVKMYFSWMGSIIGNLKSATIQAVNEDSKKNYSLDEFESVSPNEK